MKKRMASSVLALSIVLGGNGVVFGAQAASSENKGASNKATGLAIGGSCLATGLVAGIAGILGGVCLTQSYNDEAVEFNEYFSYYYDDFESLFQKIEKINYVEYCYNLTDPEEIFDDCNRNMIANLKNGLFGFKTYFTLGIFKKYLLEDAITRKQIDKNNKEEIQKLKDTIDKTISCIKNFCKLYESLFSKYDRANLLGSSSDFYEPTDIFNDPLFHDLQSVSNELINLFKILDYF